MISRTSASVAEPPPARFSLVPDAPVETLPTWPYDRVVTFSALPALLALSLALISEPLLLWLGGVDR